ncbi:hypothetical protein NPX13_g5252 [Xylaria arbuscula]|uniref:Uncharacterized protein n=1 Tax=Xylaria arbuscula TaxID=114810 RepID=A0A9W8TMK6_9PEZI|nr:hypothetical protein NPX13_g5252 [Xylaria arbuscula]
MKFTLLSLAAGAAMATDLAIMADSFIARGVSSSINYSYMVLYDGIELAYNFTSDEKYLEFYRGQIDQLVLDDGTIDGWEYDYYSLDNYRMGNNLLYFYETTGEEKYKEAATIIREQINRHPRTESGGFWHRDPNYPNQMWLDGIFMADSFYAKWTNAFDSDNTTAWDDIALQYDNIEAHTRNATTGLLVHGYDESKVAVWADPETGGAPLVWNRADAGYFKTLAAALLETQDEAGGWWLIMSEEYVGAKGNYIESSGSAMFTHGFLKGIRLGLLDSDTYLAAAQKGYELLASEFVTEKDDGTVDWEGTVEVGSLSSNGTFEYYISVPIDVNDYKGAGPFMYASWEIENL